MRRILVVGAALVTLGTEPLLTLSRPAQQCQLGGPHVAFGANRLRDTHPEGACYKLMGSSPGEG